MKKRILGIIGGSGLYQIEGLENIKWKKVNTSWGEPSDRILSATLNKKEVYFINKNNNSKDLADAFIDLYNNPKLSKKIGDKWWLLDDLILIDCNKSSCNSSCLRFISFKIANSIFLSKLFPKQRSELAEALWGSYLFCIELPLPARISRRRPGT